MKFALGLVAGVLLLPLFIYFYMREGYAPVAVTSSALPLERTLTHMALHARVAKEAPANSPLTATDDNLVAGARVYLDNCAVCHGLRDETRTAIAKGMFPKPPALLHGKGATDDPPGETYWKVKNGIRLTGMPGFVESLSDTAIWQVSILVANAHKLPSAAIVALGERK
jgi:mono/diheme cytochrome c family protein